MKLMVDSWCTGVGALEIIGTRVADRSRAERDLRVIVAVEEELRLSFRSTDSAGHMAVEGFVGVRGGGYAAKLTFSPMAFDPTELPRVLRELGELAF